MHKPRIFASAENLTTNGEEKVCAGQRAQRRNSFAAITVEPNATIARLEDSVFEFKPGNSAASTPKRRQLFAGSKCGNIGLKQLPKPILKRRKSIARIRNVSFDLGLNEIRLVSRRGEIAPVEAVRASNDLATLSFNTPFRPKSTSNTTNVPVHQNKTLNDTNNNSIEMESKVVARDDDSVTAPIEDNHTESVDDSPQSATAANGDIRTESPADLPQLENFVPNDQSAAAIDETVDISQLEDVEDCNSDDSSSDCSTPPRPQPLHMIATSVYICSSFTAIY